MNIGLDELRATGFRRAGTVYPDPAKVLRVEIDWDAQGFVVYVMVVDGEVKKVGTTGRGGSSFKARMNSSFGVVRQVIEGPVPGRPLPGWRTRPLDPFKEHAQTTIRANRRVELWATECPSFEAMMAIETELNNKYTPQWTKEGRAAASDQSNG